MSTLKGKQIENAAGGWKRHAPYIALILLAFLGLLLFVRYGGFIDEADNMLGARAIARGGLIYRDFYSQHMPVMYYLMSVFAFLGVKTYIGFRVCYALLLLCIWLFAYFRYHGQFGKLALSVYPLVYVLLVPHSWGNMVLGDGLQGQFTMVIFLEVLHYLKEKRLTMGNAAVFSLSILMTLGNAFMSAFSLFCILLIPLYYEIRRYFTEKAFLKLLPVHAAALGIVALPWVAYAVFALINGVLGASVYQAYVFNRTVYSNYIGGYGLSVPGMFVATLAGACRHIFTALTNATELAEALRLLLVIALAGGLARIRRDFKIKWPAFIAMVLFAVYTGVRGFSDFHAVTYYCMAALCASYLIQGAIQSDLARHLADGKKTVEYLIEAGKKALVVIGALLFTVVALIDFLPNFSASAADTLRGRPYPVMPEPDRVLQRTTEPGETVWLSSMDWTMAYVSNDRRPASRCYAIWPWFTDVFSQDIIEDLQRARPRFIQFDPEDDVWGGHLYGEFAADIYAYIRQHYTRVPGTDYFFLNEYYDEALEKLNAQP